MVFFETYRPKPVPVSFVVTKGSKILSTRPSEILGPLFAMSKMTD